MNMLLCDHNKQAVMGKGGLMTAGDPSNDPSLKALDILEALKDAGQNGIGLTDVAERSGLNKSTVHRIISALTKRDYVIRNDETKKYKLGFRMLQFTGVMIESLTVRSIARPHLIELGSKVEETIHLVHRDGNHGVYIDKIDCPHSVGLLSYIGKRIMLHCTGAGKVFLAYMDKDERDRLINEVGLPRRTSNTITDRNVLEEELEDIRNHGFSWNRSEDRDDVIGISAPIFDSTGHLVCAVAVAGPTYRFTEETAKQAIPVLLETTRNISDKIGYSSNYKTKL